MESRQCRYGVNMKDSSNQDDEPIKLTFFGVLLCLGISALIHYHQDWLKDMVSFLAWLHVKPFAWLGSHVQASEWLRPAYTTLIEPLALIEPYLNPATKTPIRTEEWWQIHHIAGRAVLMVHLLPMSYAMYRAWGIRPDLKFRQRYNLDSLWTRQDTSRGKVKHFGRTQRDSPRRMGTNGPENKVRGKKSRLLPEFEGSKLDTQSGPALNPEEWLKQVGLIGLDDRNRLNSEEVGSEFDREEIDKQCKDLTVEEVSEVLEGQLNSLWHGPESLVSYERVLIGAFIRHYQFNYASAMSMLNELTRLFDRHCPETGKFRTAVEQNGFLQRETEQALNSSRGQRLLAVADRHAWKCTAFIAMIKAAREECGVLASPSFSWLKRVDRTLWYALNNTGDTVAPVEVAGVYAHYRAEVEANMPLHCRRVFQVARSLLNDYLGLTPAKIQKRQERARLKEPVGNRIRSSAKHHHPVRQSGKSRC